MALAVSKRADQSLEHSNSGKKLQRALNNSTQMTSGPDQSVCLKGFWAGFDEDLRNLIIYFQGTSR